MKESIPQRGVRKCIPLEKEIVRAIAIALKGAGYQFVFKTHGAAFQAAGIPDLITIARSGRFVGLEVKRPGIGKITTLQLKMLRLINACGGYGVVVRDVGQALGAMQAADYGDNAGGYDEGNPNP
jgi:hypothetical protein